MLCNVYYFIFKWNVCHTLIEKSVLLFLFYEEPD